MSVPAYPEYKDSGVEWLGVVPSHWPVLPLKRYVTKSNAGEVIDKSHWGDGAELLYTCALEPMRSDFPQFPDRKRTEENDLLLTRNGTPYVHKPKPSSIYSNVVQRVSLADSADRDFMAWALQSSALNLKGYGVSIESLNYEMWQELRVPVPTLYEQTAIASFLDRETAKIDWLVAEQERLIALLKEKRQAVISHAVTKGLNPDAPMKNSGVEWLGQIPAHWEMVPFGWLFKFVKRQNGKAGEVLSVYRDFGVIQKSSRDDNNNKTPEDLSSYQEVAIGDLVINKMKSWQGSLGVSDFAGITSPDYAVFEPRHDSDPEFLNQLLRSKNLPDVFRSISNGIRSDQWRLEPQKLKSLRLPIPPRSEQEALAGALNKSTDLYASLTEAAESAISLLQERRAALISAAVTGKINVRAAVAAHELETA